MFYDKLNYMGVYFVSYQLMREQLHPNNVISIILKGSILHNV